MQVARLNPDLIPASSRKSGQPMVSVREGVQTAQENRYQDQGPNQISSQHQILGICHGVDKSEQQKQIHDLLGHFPVEDGSPP